MNFVLILFASAFAISGVAEFYSIAGLVAIFSSQVVGSIIMGAALGIGKLVAASWVYRNWETAPKLLLAYFTGAVVILSFITSMGIFGYLSKAHLDQSVVIGESAGKLLIYDEKIKTEKENIEANRKALKQMDEGVDQVLGRSTDEKGADKAVAMRRSQQKERTRLQNEILQSQKSIAELNDARAPIAAETRKIEAEVGPIKYVAELVYGDSSEEVIGKAVRLMIILIIFVFDPLAILLLIAANMEMNKLKAEDDYEPTVIYEVPDLDPDEIREEIEKIKHEKQGNKNKTSIASGEDQDVVIIKREKIHEFE